MREIDQQGRLLSLSVSLFVAHCRSAPAGGESDGSEENGRRCGSYRHLRRRRGGIQPGDKSSFSTPRLMMLFSVYTCNSFLLLWSENGVLGWSNELLSHTGPLSPCCKPAPSASVIGSKCCVCGFCRHLTRRVLHVVIDMRFANIVYYFGCIRKATAFIVQHSRFQALAWPPVAG